MAASGADTSSHAHALKCALIIAACSGRLALTTPYSAQSFFGPLRQHTRQCNRTDSTLHKPCGLTPAFSDRNTHRRPLPAAACGIDSQRRLRAAAEKPCVRLCGHPRGRQPAVAGRWLWQTRAPTALPLFEVNWFGSILVPSAAENLPRQPTTTGGRRSHRGVLFPIPAM